ncbi:MAG: hypothetical protein OEU90_12045 [Gammaproteobacteria bacterium]|nr:hypothetical protein [Gammaproteobacteria bacterium]MDH3806186.1 hypothetical protein [Gammaproteobacteria bacterium]
MEPESKTTLRITLGLSVLANIALALHLIFILSNEPTYEEGILTEEIRIQTFQGEPLEFVLPKGLTVADASPRGIAAAGQFEPFRFMIVVTSDRARLVSFDSTEPRSTFGPLYSADTFWTPSEDEVAPQNHESNDR